MFCVGARDSRVASYWIDLGSKKPREILTLLCCITLSSSKENQRSAQEVARPLRVTDSGVGVTPTQGVGDGVKAGRTKLNGEHHFVDHIYYMIHARPFGLQCSEAISAYARLVKFNLSISACAKMACTCCVYHTQSSRGASKQRTVATVHS